MDYDMDLEGIDKEGFKEWEKRKIAHYEEFISQRKAYINQRNTNIYQKSSL